MLPSASTVLSTGFRKRGMNLPKAEKGEIPRANMFSNPSDPINRAASL